MTTDYTSTIASALKKASVSDKMATAFKTEFKTSDDSSAFDSFLSNASKTYMDKDVSHTNSFNSKDYAKNTKTAKQPESSYSDSAKDTNAFAQQKEDSVTDKKTDNKTKTEKYKNDSVDKTSEKPQDDNVKNQDSADDVKNEVKDSDENEKVQDNRSEENSTLQAQNLTKDTQLQQTDVQQNADTNPAAAGEQTDNVQDAGVQQKAAVDEIAKVKDTVSKNTLANEKLIANIEYVTGEEANSSQAAAVTKTDISTGDVKISNEASTDSVVLQQQGEKLEKISQDVVDKVLQNFKNGSTQNTAATVPLATDVVPDAELQNLMKTSDKSVQEAVSEAVVNSDIEVDVEMPQSQKTEVQANTTVKTAKENLASDTSRLTVKLESDVAPTADDTAVLTPTSKTETTTAKSQTAETAPFIKVTDEAASQAKPNVDALANKDLTSSAKEKAVAQMTDLQSTNTVVTDVQNQNRNQSQSQGNQNNNSMMRGNAAEQVAKLSVDNASNSSNISGTESFLNKLDSKLSSMTKPAAQSPMLNKTDIMSQVNAKFNEMQLAGQNKVSIILQPENLGKVSVEIINSKDGIVAKMTTENQQVKELFDKNVEALKSSLSAQGVNVNNIKVECTNESSNNAMNFERDQFNQNNFSDSQGHNRQTHNQEQTAQTAYGPEYSTTEEAADEINNTKEIKNTESIIKHNGKVDYTV